MSDGLKGSRALLVFPARDDRAQELTVARQSDTLRRLVARLVHATEVLDSTTQTTVCE